MDRIDGDARTPRGLGGPRASLIMMTLLTAWSVDAAAQEAATDLLGLEPFAATPAALLAAADAAADAHGEEDGFYLLRRAHYRINEQHGFELDLHYVYRPVTEAGLANATRAVAPWLPTLQDRPRIQARVIGPDGREHWLDESTIAEHSPQDPNGLSLSDARFLVAPLPRVKTGTVIEVRVLLAQPEPVFASGAIHEWPLFADAPIRRLRLTVDAPKSLPFEYRTYGADDLDVARTTVGQNQRLTVSRRDIGKFDYFELLTPGDVNQFPLARFSTARSWKQSARNYLGVFESRLTDDVSGLLAEIVADANGRDEQIRAIVEWLDERVRYTAIDFGQGRVVPRTPLETVARGFGDCKDKATLLIALLRAAGIEAELALLRAGPGPDVDPALPALGSFNHTIVYLPGREPMWIDPTGMLTRPGLLPAPDQNRLALLITDSTRKLLRTPATGPKDNVQHVVADMRLTPTGTSTVVERDTVSGGFEPTTRQMIQALIDMVPRDRLLDAFNESEDGDRVTEYSHDDPTDLSGPFELVMTAELHRSAAISLAEAWVDPDVTALLSDLPAELATGTNPIVARLNPEAAGRARENPLELELPYVVTRTINIELPAGYALDEGQEDYRRSLGPMRLERTIRRESETRYVLKYAFDTDRRVFSAAEVTAAATAIQEMIAEPRELLRFHHVGERYFAASDYVAAIAEFRRLVELDGDDGLAMSRLARGLIEIGLIDAAQDYARRGAAASPDVDEVQWVLGLALGKNPLGETFVAPFDAAGAAAALTRAAELDPDNIDAPWLLGVLEERGPDGVFLGDDADPDAALAHYRSIAGRANGEELARRMLNILIGLERYDEIEEAAGLFPASTTRDQYVLAAIGTLTPDETTAAVSRMSPKAAVRGTLLENAGYLLADWRRYEPASGLYRASRRYTDSNVSDRMLSLLETTEAPGDETPPLKTVEGTYRAFIRQVLADASNDSLRGLYAPSVRGREFIADEVTGIRGMARSVGGNLSKGRLPPALYVDATVASIGLEVEGDDALGYRVTARAPDGPSSHAFVVPEDDGYWLLTTTARAPIGERALAHLDAGDTAAAWTWLQWGADFSRRAWGLSATADDPYDADGYLALWETSDDDDTTIARGLTQSLIAMGERVETAIPELERLRDTAPDGRVILAYELVLAQAYAVAERYDDQAALAARWLETSPESLAAFRYALNGYSGAGRWDDMRRLVETRLALLPDDRGALQGLAGYYDAIGETASALELYEQIVAAGADEAGDLNALAWSAVVAGKVDEQTLEYARQASHESRYTSYAIMHTLACVYAELGRADEAHRSIIAAINLKRDRAFGPDDYYVLGQIAQQLGLYDYARRAYEKVEPPSDLAMLPVSPYVLARQRIEQLPRLAEADGPATDEPPANDGLDGDVQARAR